MYYISPTRQDKPRFQQTASLLESATASMCAAACRRHMPPPPTIPKGGAGDPLVAAFASLRDGRQHVRSTALLRGGQVSRVPAWGASLGCLPVVPVVPALWCLASLPGCLAAHSFRFVSPSRLTVEMYAWKVKARLRTSIRAVWVSWFRSFGSSPPLESNRGHPSG